MNASASTTTMFGFRPGGEQGTPSPPNLLRENGFRVGIGQRSDRRARHVVEASQKRGEETAGRHARRKIAIPERHFPRIEQADDQRSAPHRREDDRHRNRREQSQRKPVSAQQPRFAGEGRHVHRQRRRQNPDHQAASTHVAGQQRPGVNLPEVQHDVRRRQRFVEQQEFPVVGIQQADKRGRCQQQGRDGQLQQQSGSPAPSPAAGNGR